MQSQPQTHVKTKSKTGLIIGVIVIVILVAVIIFLGWYFWDTLFPPEPSDDSGTPTPARAPGPARTQGSTPPPPPPPPPPVPAPSNPPPPVPAPSARSPVPAPSARSPIARGPGGLPIGYTELTGTDASGNDIENIQNDIDLCISKCNEDTSCAGYVINTTNNNCWMKSDIRQNQRSATNRNLYYKSGQGTPGATTLVGKTFRAQNTMQTEYMYITFTDSQNAKIMFSRPSGTSSTDYKYTYITGGVNPGFDITGTGISYSGVYNSTNDTLQANIQGYSGTFVRYIPSPSTVTTPQGSSTSPSSTGSSTGGQDETFACVGLDPEGVAFCNEDAGLKCCDGLVESYNQPGLSGSCVCVSASPSS